MKNTYILESAAPRTNRWVALAAMLVVLVGLAALVAWSNGVFQERVDYRIVLDENVGISTSSAVTISGLPVGRVRATQLVERDGNLRVEVRFWVTREGAAWLREGSRVLVQSDLVDAARLELQPALAGRGVLPAGAELPAAVAPDLMAQLMELQPTIKALLDEVSDLIGGLNARADQFDPILAKIERQIDGLDRHLNEATGAIGDVRGLVAQATRDEKDVMAGVSEALQQVNEALLPELTDTVRSNRAEIEQALVSLNTSLAAVEAQLPALMKLSQETMQNSRDLTEAAVNTWPFSVYHRRKSREADDAENNERERRPVRRGPR